MLKSANIFGTAFLVFMFQGKHILFVSLLIIIFHFQNHCTHFLRINLETKINQLQSLENKTFKQTAFRAIRWLTISRKSIFGRTRTSYYVVHWFWTKCNWREDSSWFGRWILLFADLAISWRRPCENLWRSMLKFSCSVELFSGNIL